MNVIKKSMMNENTDKNDQNTGSDQGEPTENVCEDLVNVLESNVSLSFKNIEG